MAKTKQLSIKDVNEKFFSSKKDEVNIMTDLGNCAKRIIYILTIEKLMQLASEHYEPNHIEKITQIDKNGRKGIQTTSSYIDLDNFASLREIHLIMFDGLMISLRNFFYCSPNSNSAGTFVMKLANFENLKKANEKHRIEYNLFGYSIEFINKRDIMKKEKILKSGKKIDLSDFKTENNFMIASDAEKFIVYYNIYSEQAQKLAIKFYRDNYLAEDNKRLNNISDIKEYEKFYFHKDQWPDNKRWKITTDTEDFGAIKINHNHYENLCEADMGRLFSRLEELVEIMNLYYQSCVALGLNRSMNIYCNVFGSLPKMVADICDCFAIKKPDGLVNEIVQNIENKIPNTINAMQLAK